MRNIFLFSFLFPFSFFFLFSSSFLRFEETKTEMGRSWEGAVGSDGVGGTWHALHALRFCGR